MDDILTKDIVALQNPDLVLVENELYEKHVSNVYYSKTTGKYYIYDKVAEKNINRNFLEEPFDDVQFAKWVHNEAFIVKKDGLVGIYYDNFGLVVDIEWDDIKLVNKYNHVCTNDLIVFELYKNNLKTYVFLLDLLNIFYSNGQLNKINLENRGMYDEITEYKNNKLSRLEQEMLDFLFKRNGNVWSVSSFYREETLLFKIEDCKVSYVYNDIKNCYFKYKCNGLYGLIKYNYSENLTCFTKPLYMHIVWDNELKLWPINEYGECEKTIFYNDNLMIESVDNYIRKDDILEEKVNETNELVVDNSFYGKIKNKGKEIILKRKKF